MAVGAHRTDFGLDRENILLSRWLSKREGSSQAHKHHELHVLKSV